MNLPCPICVERKIMPVQDIKEAELVLVGIGGEMQVKLQSLKNIPNFSEKFSVLQEEQSRQWVIPFLIRYYLKQEFHPEIAGAYKKLKEILEGKNYFIVSLSSDDLIRNIGFQQERITLPCGGYEMMQCAENCREKLFPVDEELWNKVCGWIEDSNSLQEQKEPKCPDCGSELVMNQYGEPAYYEGGYLESWKRYTKWLQGTVNRKLCILELGAGMELPSAIRWPFEKMCFYNQKSVFWRVHSSLYQLSEEISMRGISVRKDPVAFLNEL